MKKIVLITGTSSGLGISLAVKLAQAGHDVFATMRNTDKKGALIEAAESADVSVQVKQLDVQDTDSIQRCVDEIFEERGRIDVLINNAGAGFIRTTEHATIEDIQWVMDVNFLGVVRTTKAVLPHMRTARSGHVVNISSVGGLVGQPFNEIYCAAKFALEGYVESVSTYITPSFKVHFTNVEPGGIKSDFAANVLARFEDSGGMIDDEYKPLLEKYIGGATSRTGDVYQTTDEVADVVMACIHDPDPPVRIQTSDWAKRFCRFKIEADPTGKLQNESVIKEFM